MLARKWDKVDDGWRVCPQGREWEMDNPGSVLAVQALLVS